MSLIDLHIHSTLSDGTLSPEEIVSLAKERGLVALSITDHDTLAAYPALHQLGQAQGLEIITGIEVTAHQDDLSLHLLGYGLDPQSLGLTTALDEIQEARQERNRGIIARLNDLNIPLRLEDLPNHQGQTGRPHIARALTLRGVVRSEQEAFARFLRKDGAAYVKRQLLPVRQAMAMIIEAGGLPVLAHPGTMKLHEAALARLVNELKDQGLAGIEVHHPMNGENTRHLLRKLCQTLGLLVTGGSDFHGREGDRAPLGESGGRRPVPAALLPPLSARLGQPLPSPPLSDTRHAHHPHR